MVERVTEPSMMDVHSFVGKLIAECKGKKCIFRGVNECYEEDEIISSQLYRQYRGVFNDRFKAVDIEKKIVENAKKYFPDNASHIEILTDIKHFGGETALINFTHNIYIALFFACHGNPGGDGELIILFTDDVATLKEIDYKELPDKITMVEPAHTQASRNRVLSQSSVFLSAPKGYLPKSECQTQQIPREFKEPLLDFLRNYHNMNIDTIFSDLIGFISNKSQFFYRQVFTFTRV